MDFSAHSIIWILLAGLVIGAIAKLLMPGKDPGGCIITMLIGIAGSFVASYLGQAMGWYQQGQPAGFIASVIGAMLLLLLYRLIAGRRCAFPCSSNLQLRGPSPSARLGMTTRERRARLCHSAVACRGRRTSS